MACSLASLQVRPAASKPAPITYQGPSSLAALAEAVEHSVVNISTTQVLRGGPLQGFQDFFGDDFFRRFFGERPQSSTRTHSLGSGFVIRQDGLILTNNHVIDKATEIRVKLDSGFEYAARVVGRDSLTDLALIRVEPDANFPKPVVLGSSAQAAVGDWLMAVGNPFGLGHTVTCGIISAKGRVLGTGPYDEFIQTDAAINPGNSGGPSFNMKGEVIGINTAIVARAQGIGFAIPVDIAKELLPQLEKGKIERGWLGVTVQDVTPALAKEFDLKDTKGVLISGVAQGSPADKAGLQRGDIVLRYGGKEVENAQTFAFAVAMTPPYSKATLDVLREGEKKTIEVVVGKLSEEQAEEQPAGELQSSWGFGITPLTPELARQLGLGRRMGVVISSIEPGGPADRAELRVGDLIVQIDRQKVEGVSDYTRAMRQAAKKKTLLLLVHRGGSSFYAVLEREKP